MQKTFHLSFFQWWLLIFRFLCFLTRQTNILTPQQTHEKKKERRKHSVAKSASQLDSCRVSKRTYFASPLSLVHLRWHASIHHHDRAKRRAAPCDSPIKIYKTKSQLMRVADEVEVRTIEQRLTYLYGFPLFCFFLSSSCVLLHNRDYYYQNSARTSRLLKLRIIKGYGEGGGRKELLSLHFVCLCLGVRIENSMSIASGGVRWILK